MGMVKMILFEPQLSRGQSYRRRNTSETSFWARYEAYSGGLIYQPAQRASKTGGLKQRTRHLTPSLLYFCETTGSPESGARSPEWRRRNHGTQRLGGSIDEWPTRQKRKAFSDAGVSVVRQHPAVISETTVNSALNRATAGNPTYKASSDRTESVAYRIDNLADPRIRIGGRVPVLGDSNRPTRRYADAV